MNKEVVKKNLIFVFLKNKEAKKIMNIRIDAENAEREADEALRGARGFLRKSIKDVEEVYVANINGKDYKIKPCINDEYDVIIEEIKIIK